MNKYRRAFVLLSLLLLLGRSTVQADIVMQMNLRQIVGHANKVFRGTVISATAGTVWAGGGEIPTITYRLRVDESFKGDFQTIKGMSFTEIRLLAMPSSRQGLQFQSSISSMIPQLEIGRSYVLLTTRPSAIGMSSPVGLSQGCFRITGKGSDEVAVNGYGNQMLFKGMENESPQISASRQNGGPMRYSQLAEQIRRLVKEGRSR